MLKNGRADDPDAFADPLPAWFEIPGIVLLLVLAVFFVATSWRKWPDPLIDFGNGLYAAWRLANGAVLYRDVDVDYGPLSQYVSGALFALFGPGMMVMVAANLVVFVAIAAVLYLLCRRAWGFLPALVANAIFIVVFAFSQFVTTGNYNYATPYSQETTHGLLTCLLLVVVLACWVEESADGYSLLAGGLFGITALLKPEVMLAAASITLAAVLIRSRSLRRPGVRTLSVWTIGAAIPTAAFAFYFSIFLDWRAALAAAGHAWLSVGRLSGDLAQRSFMGLDRPWEHVRQQLFATLLASLFIGGIAFTGWLGDRASRRWHVAALGGLLAVAVATASGVLIPWLQVGRCLLGLMLAYLSICVAVIYRRNANPPRQVQVLRVLLGVLATALLARMALNVRIYHYGYYQAALAAVLVPAIMIGELPLWLSLRRRGTAILIAGCAALILPGLVILAHRSQTLLRARTAPVGEGRDRFYTFPGRIDPRGEIVDNLVMELQASLEKGRLVVVPEGAMINYLARLPSPVAPLYFYSGVTENGQEREVVAQLERDPPDAVVMISRDLREYGIDRYGEQSGTGAEILAWIEKAYERRWFIGGDPLDYRQRGAVILRLKTGRP